MLKEHERKDKSSYLKLNEQAGMKSEIGMNL